MLVINLISTSSREMGRILSSSVAPSVFGTKQTVISCSWEGMQERDIHRFVRSVRKVRYVSSNCLRRAAESSDGPGALFPMFIRTFLNSLRVSLGGEFSSCSTCWVRRMSRTQG